MLQARLFQKNVLEKLIPVSVTSIDDKPEIIQIALYPLAIKHFIKSLPTIDFLENHRLKIRNILKEESTQKEALLSK